METLIWLLLFLVKIDLILAAINALLLVTANLTAPTSRRGPLSAFLFGFVVGLIPPFNWRFPIKVYIPKIKEHLG